MSYGKINESPLESTPIEPLERACIYMRTKEEDKALFLLKKHNELIHDWKNKYGNSIANVAAWNGCIGILSFLKNLRFCFDLESLSVMGARHLSVLKFLKDNNILQVNAKGDGGTTPLQQACNIADNILGFKMDEELIPECLERIHFLIANGADIDQRNDSNRTALMGAAYIGAYPIVQLLLEYGANCSPDIRCEQGKSTIDYAFGEYTENLIRNSLIR
jgi:ankyrin repeat protein